MNIREYAGVNRTGKALDYIVFSCEKCDWKMMVPIVGGLEPTGDDIAEAAARTKCWSCEKERRESGTTEDVH